MKTLMGAQFQHAYQKFYRSILENLYLCLYLANNAYNVESKERIVIDLAHIFLLFRLVHQP
jgi:hypothetical protein